VEYVRLAQPLADTDVLAVLEMLEVGVIDEETLMQIVGDTLPVTLSDGDVLRVIVALFVRLVETEALSETVPQEVAEMHEETEEVGQCDTEAHRVGDGEGVMLPLPDNEGEGLAELVEDWQVESLELGEEEVDDETLLDVDCVPVRQPLALTVTVLLLVIVPLLLYDGVAVEQTDAHEVSDDEVVGD
jgi:hypothetical protein